MTDLSDAPERRTGGPRTKRAMRALIFWGVVCWSIFAVFAWLSRDFGYETPGSQRPLLAVVILLLGAFACYVPALWAAVRADGHRDLLPAVWIFAAAFRATVLFTEPFQEIDLYRYIWDGHVAARGVSPYRFSPRQVLQANPRSELPEDLHKLAELRDSDPALATILTRVHFSELTTVYPPVSQAVFLLAAVTTPRDADVRTHLVVMKSWIVVFDLLTLFFVIRILRHMGKPVGWSVAYGWCPLVVKEFANSGHLDSIAVCLTIGSVYLAVKVLFPHNGEPAESDGGIAAGRQRGIWPLVVSGLLLGLAIGAKLYPVVLSLLFGVAVFRRFGWRVAAWFTAFTAVVSFISLLPMFAPVGPASPNGANGHSSRSASSAAGGIGKPLVPPVPGVPDDGDAPQPALLPVHEVSRPPMPGESRSGVPKGEPKPPGPQNDGLRAFLSQWKMNDFLFQLVEANVALKPDREKGSAPWFAVTPHAWRAFLHRVARPMVKTAAASTTGSNRDVSPREADFFLARIITGGVFVTIAVWLAWSVPVDGGRERFLESAFLTLAWFWLLQPTQNPWYWIWASPLIPFARSRAWLALSGLVLIYYLRFWFQHYLWGVDVLGTSYRGTAFYDSVVVMLEFGPWFLWLFVSYMRRKQRRPGK